MIAAYTGLMRYDPAERIHLLGVGGRSQQHAASQKEPQESISSAPTGCRMSFKLKELQPLHEQKFFISKAFTVKYWQERVVQRFPNV